MFDVVVIGGGPAGLQAGLTLGRGQRSAVVLDAGPPRNARAHRVHNFLTRDGTPPGELRALGRAELAGYGVEVRSARVLGVDGSLDDFTVRTDAGDARGRRVLLATGLVDVLPELPGLAELWGETVFQCPFCHGHAVRGLRWAVKIEAVPHLVLAANARSWTPDVVALVCDLDISADTLEKLDRAGVRVERRALAGLRPSASDPSRLGSLVFADGSTLDRDALILHPPQEQTPLVRSLGLALDEGGRPVVDGFRQTSRPGIYAAGDLTSPMQAAILAAAAGSAAAGAICHGLAAELLA